MIDEREMIDDRMRNEVDQSRRTKDKGSGGVIVSLRSWEITTTILSV